MKKLVRLICLAAILCVVYLVLTTPRGEAAPVIKPIDEALDGAVSRADEALDGAVSRADDAIEDAVKQADAVIDNAVEQADKALTDAVESAAEGAKQGFLESLKESANEFWKSLFN